MKNIFMILALLLGFNANAQLNTTMSNMGTTSMNADLIFASSNGVRSIKTGNDIMSLSTAQSSTSSAGISAQTGVSTSSTGSTGSWLQGTGSLTNASSTGSSGPVVQFTGDVLGTANSGDFSVSTGASVDGNTGSYFLNIPSPSGSGYRGAFFVFAESIQAQTDHGLQLSQTAAQPTCTSGYQGTLYYNVAGSGVADTLEICMKLADDSFAWHVVP